MRTSRTCSKCGRRYHRRNIVEQWVRTNPGHRIGWQKAVVKVCTDCMTASQAQRLVAMINIGTVRPLRRAG